MQLEALKQLNKELSTLALTNQPSVTTDPSVTPPPYDEEGDFVATIGLK